jgi:hypothetical protein
LFNDAWNEGRRETAIDHMGQALGLSRNLRNKAPLAAYMQGASVEENALSLLEVRLPQDKPPTELLQRALDELNRHAAETPPALDCLKAECFRAGGVLKNATSWTFYSGPDGAGPDGAGRVREGSLAGGIALSLELPWEAERKTRLWRAVWAGLFRGVETPLWQTPGDFGKFDVGKKTTSNILSGWLPDPEDASPAFNAAQLAHLLDDSWLSDERLFAPVVPLRTAALKSQATVDSSRLILALALYRMKEGKTAKKLDDLVPKYMSELPIDPYSGQPFRYRISPGEFIGVDRGQAQPGQGLLWSVGPNRIDDGGLADDLLKFVPHWP